ncbi:MAG TPA: serine hydrolase domain-containing protein [Gaiellaceae bacterium]|nr:serine hydrolase domain-containing protein [Gaiellaceae bacterium]
MASAAADKGAEYEAKAASFVKENRLPGAAVGVVHEGKLVWSKGIGFADLRTKRRSTPKTLYRIASITKTFTAAAIMQLRDAGKLDLDDRAVEHIPELSAASGSLDQLTIRRMLSHESGLQSEPPGTDWTRVEYESDPVQTLARAADISTTVPPSTQWKYSNLAYQLLGEIVQRVSGVPYQRYVRTKLLSPLKMTATSFDPLPPRLRARKATGYEPRFLSDELEVAPRDHEIFGAEGGLWSCVEDLARWLSCQFDPKPILSEETAREMHKPRYLVDPEWTRAWAIGWYARRRENAVWIMHSGGHYGFITNACFDPKEKVGAIALLNGFGDATGLAMDLGTIARDAVKAAAPAIEPPKKLPRKWRDFVGLYVMKHFGDVVRVEWKDGKLTLIDPTDPTWTPTLAATDDPDVFVIEPGFRESGELVRFQRGKDGRVVSVVVAVATIERLEPVSAT